MIFEDVTASLRQVRRARIDLRAVGLHHDSPVGLLLEADADHVDRAIETHHTAGERHRRTPLARAGLCGKSLYTLLAIVVGLGDGGVGFVAARRADTFVLVVDV